MVRVNVQGDMNKILSHAKRLHYYDAYLANVTALNRTVRWLRTQAKRRVAAAAQVPVGPVNRRLVITKARRSRTGREPAAWLGMLQRPVPVIQLGARETRSGVTAGRHRYDGAFKGQGHGGYIQVFRRLGPRAHPIDAVKIDLAPHRPLVDGLVMRESGGRWRLEFHRALAARLRKAKR